MDGLVFASRNPVSSTSISISTSESQFQSQSWLQFPFSIPRDIRRSPREKPKTAVRTARASTGSKCYLVAGQARASQSVLLQLRWTPTRSTLAPHRLLPLKSCLSRSHSLAGQTAADADVTTKKHPNLVLPNGLHQYAHIYTRKHTQKQQLLPLSSPPSTAPFQSCRVGKLSLLHGRFPAG